MTMAISYMFHLNCKLLCSQPKLKEQTKRVRKRGSKATDKRVSSNVSNMRILEILSILKEPLCMEREEIYSEYENIIACYLEY